MKMILTQKEITQRKVVKKYSEINVDLSDIRGKIKIRSVRRYSWNYEVDIDFSGDIYCRVDRNPADWISSNIFKKYPKKQVNRIIRKKLFFKLRNYLYHFNVDISNVEGIKKIVCE
jgi:hypothetical protein